MKIEKLGAIDIGSNAIRLLISNAITKKSVTQFKKSALIRVPIRLGEDSFIKGTISDKNKSRMIKAMKAFQLLMEVHGVKRYKACATSAMREAENGKEVVEQIAKESGIEIDVIDGKKEAAIIFSTDVTNVIKEDKSYLYVDVGGGSTELTVFSKGRIVNSKSFKLGTVRLLNQKEGIEERWDEMKSWIQTNTSYLDNLSLIGSGGNINKLFKLSEKAEGKPLSERYLKKQFKLLLKLSYEERISELGLNPDRADVIIPATQIFLAAMKWSKANKIYVPKIGLADGIIKNLFFYNI